MYRLVFQKGSHEGRIVSIEQGKILLGRDPSCSIRLADDLVAPKHCVIEHLSTGVTIQALSSQHPTKINGVAITSAAIRAGDLIEIGSTSIRYQRDETITTEPRRKTHSVQALAMFAIIAVILFEVAFVIGLAIWQKFEPKHSTPNKELPMPEEVEMLPGQLPGVK